MFDLIDVREIEEGDTVRMEDNIFKIIEVPAEGNVFTVRDEWDDEVPLVLAGTVEVWL